MLHFIYHCMTLQRVHISVEIVILAAISCPPISEFRKLLDDLGNDCLNLGNTECKLEAASLVFPNL